MLDTKRLQGKSLVLFEEHNDLIDITKYFIDTSISQNMGTLCRSFLSRRSYFRMCECFSDGRILHRCRRIHDANVHVHIQQPDFGTCSLTQMFIRRGVPTTAWCRDNTLSIAGSSIRVVVCKLFVISRPPMAVLAQGIEPIEVLIVSLLPAC